ncbi:MAG: T9SS type A sorting domain-containing protein [Hymenobacter sp.]|nr:MAG: T9SS type A sorting domain-containing protein [Hymenobacter sp.]
MHWTRTLIILTVSLILLTPSWGQRFTQALRLGPLAGGPSGSATVNKIAVDALGNSYVAGSFSGNLTLGANTLSSQAGDGYIAKRDSAGTWLWVRQIGGSDNDTALRLGLDAAGRVYLAGEFYSATMQVGNSTLTKVGTNSNKKDIFIACLDGTTGAWRWALRAGGSENESLQDLVVDPAASALYVTGSFDSTTVLGSNTLTSAGPIDLYVGRLTLLGTWDWAVRAGSSTGNELGTDLALDNSGNPYLCGSVSGSASFGSLTVTAPLYSSDIFVAKLSPTGSWQWVETVGGTYSDRASSIAIDAQGAITVAGYFESTLSFGPTKLVTNDGNATLFIARLSAARQWQWALAAGGDRLEEPGEVVLDGVGNAYLTGDFFSSVASFGSIEVLNSSSVSCDVFVAKATSTGTWAWAVPAGGIGDDGGRCLALDGREGLYAGGYFNGSPADFGTLSLSRNPNPYPVAFMARLTTALAAGFSYPNTAFCPTKSEAGSNVKPTLILGGTAGTFSASPSGLALNATTGFINPSVSRPGTYTIINTVAALGGSPIVSTSTEVIINAPEPTPVLTLTYAEGKATLTSSAAANNLFYYKGVLVAGTTDNTLVVDQATQAGLYTVVVSPPRGCPSQAASVRITMATTNQAADAGLQLAVYPEPATGAPRMLSLSGSWGPVTLTLRNTLGQQVWQTQVALAATPQQVSLPTGLTGMYILVAESIKGRVTRRLIE